MKHSSFIVCIAAALMVVSFAVRSQAGPAKAGNATGAPSASGAFLADRHEAAGIGCAECHGKDREALIPNRVCLACHESFEKLAARTEDMRLNPHRSPHFKDLECTSCHVGHKSDANFCRDCHGPISRKK